MLEESLEWSEAVGVTVIALTFWCWTIASDLRSTVTTRHLEPLGDSSSSTGHRAIQQTRSTATVSDLA